MMTPPFSIWARPALTANVLCCPCSLDMFAANMMFLGDNFEI
jgi:hypothetical protein